MEICGGQTHAIVKHGLDALLPSELTLVHGPGCPVCVTPLALIDKAVAIASLPGVLFTSFGDMLRVPGSERDLLSVKAAGGNIRIVYSPLDAVALAREHPDKQVVFFAVGFETTAPANAMAVLQAERESLKNFFILSAPCPCAAGNQSNSLITGQPCPGFSCRRACLFRDGVRRVPPPCETLSHADCRHRLRTRGYSPGDTDGGAAARTWFHGSGKPVRALCGAKATPRRGKPLNRSLR